MAGQSGVDALEHVQLNVPPHPSAKLTPHWVDTFERTSVHVFLIHARQLPLSQIGVDELVQPQESVPPHPSLKFPQVDDVCTSLQSFFLQQRTGVVLFGFEQEYPVGHATFTVPPHVSLSLPHTEFPLVSLLNSADVFGLQHALLKHF
jgi:hypothetical protein